jgi:hypothetical protein
MHENLLIGFANACSLVPASSAKYIGIYSVGLCMSVIAARRSDKRNKEKGIRDMALCSLTYWPLRATSNSSELTPNSQLRQLAISERSLRLLRSSISIRCLSASRFLLALAKPTGFQGRRSCDLLFPSYSSATGLLSILHREARPCVWGGPH